MNNLEPLTFNLERRTSVSLALSLALLLLLVLAAPCRAAEIYRLPSMPSLPSSERSEAGGVVAPDRPEDEAGYPSSAKGYKDTAESPKSTEAPKQNKNKINHQPVGGRIDARIEGNNRLGKPIRNGTKAEADKELSPDENAAVPSIGTPRKEWKKPPSVLRNSKEYMKE